MASRGNSRSITARNSPASMRVFRQSTKALAWLLCGSGKRTLRLPVTADPMASQAFWPQGATGLK
jgi:hypothetical protein